VASEGPRRLCRQARRACLHGRRAGKYDGVYLPSYTIYPFATNLSICNTTCNSSTVLIHLWWSCFFCTCFQKYSLWNLCDYLHMIRFCVQCVHFIFHSILQKSKFFIQSNLFSIMILRNVNILFFTLIKLISLFQKFKIWNCLDVFICFSFSVFQFLLMSKKIFL